MPSQCLRRMRSTVEVNWPLMQTSSAESVHGSNRKGRLHKSEKLRTAIARHGRRDEDGRDRTCYTLGIGGIDANYTLGNGGIDAKKSSGVD